MAYSEFPHGHYLEYDEHQIILLMKKLESEYAEILDNSRVARAKADEALNAVNSYMQTVDAKINQQVSSAVKQATANLKQDFVELNSRFNILTNNFSVLRNEVRNEIDRINAEMDLFQKSIRAEINNKMTEIDVRLTNKYDLTDRLVMARINQLERVMAEAINKMSDDWNIDINVAINELSKEINATFMQQYEHIIAMYEEIKNSPVYNNVGWLWNNLCQIGGFSAIEIYQYPEFNVDMWNKSGITCKDWFTNGKQILGYNKEKMFSEITGSVEQVNRVVTDLIRLLDSLGIIQNGNDAMHTCRKEECVCQVPKHQI